MNLQNLGIIPTTSIIYSNQMQYSPTTPTNHPSQVFNQIQQLFIKFDTNHTGQLDSEQLSNFLNYAIKQNILDDKWKYQFYEYRSKMDTNRDGLISKAEFMQFMKNLWIGKVANVGNIQSMGNGFQNQEIATGKNVRDLAQLQKKKIDDLFFKYDRNHTGYLDFEETNAYLKEEWNNKYTYFEIKQKTGSNGLISKKELLSFLTQLINK